VPSLEFAAKTNLTLFSNARPSNISKKREGLGLGPPRPSIVKHLANNVYGYD